jgi:hypothetical protein
MHFRIARGAICAAVRLSKNMAKGRFPSTASPAVAVALSASADRVLPEVIATAAFRVSFE